MGPTNGVVGVGGHHRLGAVIPPVPKSITFHDFCDLTQRDLAELSLRNGRAGQQQQQLSIWRQQEECIQEEEDAEECADNNANDDDDERPRHTAQIPLSLTMANVGSGKDKEQIVGPRWHSMSMDDRDQMDVEFQQNKNSKKMALAQQQQQKNSGGKRKRGALNATFSAWLQLFLAKRRHRHNNRYVDTRGFGGMMMHQSCYDGIAGPNGGPLRSTVSLSVVHEGAALGSDGESIEVSPCTSDQSGGGGGADGTISITGTLLATSASMMSMRGAAAAGNDNSGGGGEYIPKVKMRHKQHRRWTEEDIQKRLSLPSDIKLPQNVIDKLNRTPTLENPLTRKSKRASLSEIGFGKLETYKKIFDLGEGTYATVYLGKSLLTGKNVALKEIRLEHEEGAPCTAIREVSLLRNLKHANIVTLHDIVYTDRVLTLVFEFVERDLREYMEELDGMISIANVKLFLVQLLRGLAYCHARRILHRDLKPQNLLINRAGELKLADFGLARAQSVPTKTYSNEVVTLWYRPPDVLLGSIDYSTHIDMWGVGCILYEMLLHKPMFPGSTTDEQLNLIFQRLGTPLPDCHSDICALPNFKSVQFRVHSAKSLLCPPRITGERADLLHKLLQYEGRQRISALEAMHHQFLQCFPEQLFKLADTDSVLSLPGIHYIRDNHNELHNNRSSSCRQT